MALYLHTPTDTDRPQPAIPSRDCDDPARQQTSANNSALQPEQVHARQASRSARVAAVLQALASFAVRPWKGAAGWVLVMALTLAAIVGSALKTGMGTASDVLVAMLVFATLVTLSRLVVAGIGAAVRLVPWSLLHSLSRMPPWSLVRVTCAVFSAFLLALSWLSPVFALSLLLFGIPLVLLGAISAGLVVAARRCFGRRPIVLAVAALAAVPYVAGAAWLAAPGTDTHLPDRGTLLADSVPPVPLVAASDPSQRGKYAVRTLSYGSGTDYRAEYGAGADLKTAPVDASPLLPQWTGFKAALREQYWGFGPRQFPLNGRVWAPAVSAGGGPFPLVLIVHGNVHMADPSETGYAYLGELLASRGFIVASVDQNFLNASWTDDLRSDMPVRAWLLLKHLEVWREWNSTLGHLFAGKVDMTNVALIGHSRGGEAVAIAAALTRNAEEWHDLAVPVPEFLAPVKAVVAIAPTDGTYRPDGPPIALEDVNYLGVEGGHDGNGPSLIANRQYQRVTFTAPGDRAVEAGGAAGYWFKATVYAHRANHGQFNTAWGRLDWPRPLSWLVNTRPLLPAEEQRQIARVYISSFLEASLRGVEEYVPVFRDHRSSGSWFPADHYVTGFEDSSFRVVADFEEDTDVATTGIPGATARGEHLSVWREQPLVASSPSSVGGGGGRATYLAWETPGPVLAPADAAYTVTLPDSLAGQWRLSRESELVFSLATVGGPASVEVELVGEDGASSRLPLSQFAPLRPMPATQVLKSRMLGGLLGLDLAEERLLQTYTLPLNAFIRANEAFDPAELKMVRLHFDRSSAGAVLLDRIGFGQGVHDSMR